MMMCTVLGKMMTMMAKTSATSSLLLACNASHSSFSLVACNDYQISLSFSGNSLLRVPIFQKCRVWLYWSFAYGDLPYNALLKK